MALRCVMLLGLLSSRFFKCKPTYSDCQRFRMVQTPAGTLSLELRLFCKELGAVLSQKVLKIICFTVDRLCRSLEVELFFYAFMWVVKVA